MRLFVIPFQLCAKLILKFPYSDHYHPNKATDGNYPRGIEDQTWYKLEGQVPSPLPSSLLRILYRFYFYGTHTVTVKRRTIFVVWVGSLWIASGRTKGRKFPAQQDSMLKGNHFGHNLIHLHCPSILQFFVPSTFSERTLKKHGPRIKIAYDWIMSLGIWNPSNRALNRPAQDCTIETIDLEQQRMSVTLPDPEVGS